MIYQQAGALTANNRADRRWVRHPIDRWALTAFLAFAALAVPVIGNDYIFSAILLPFLALSLAAIGLNILTGYAGQLSLGTTAFMAVGAYAAYNLNLRIPGLPLLASIVLAGVTAALFGILFGLPSLRLKGFYLAVSTLAAQFFVEWALNKIGWFSNNNSSGVITAPPMAILGIAFDTPARKYLLSLGIVAVLTLIAIRLTRSQTGRNWIATRDREVAAASIGVPVFRVKLVAFAISSFYCGIAGVLWAFTYLGTVEPDGFDLSRSFEVLFIIILGGLGSIRGCFLGAAVMVAFPLLLSRFANAFFATALDPGIQEDIENILFGSLIVLFLVKQPLGLVRLWDQFKRRLETWPLSD
jgi:branched-chain amino acid transport system permease protein